MLSKIKSVFTTSLIPFIVISMLLGLLLFLFIHWMILDITIDFK